MNSTLFSLVPMIIGSALAPLHIIMVLLILTGPGKSVLKASAFVLGMTAVRVGQGILFGFIFTGGAEAAEPGGESSSWVVSTLMLVLGILFLISAYRGFTGEEDPDAPPPKWMALFDTMSLVLAFAIGAGLLLIAPKMWVLTLSAIGTIEEAALGQPGSTITFLIFVLLAEVLLIVPLLVRIILPDRSDVWFASFSAWLDEHKTAIVTAVSLLFGLLFFYKGVSGFF